MRETERLIRRDTPLGVMPSADGYLRLTLEGLRALPLVHLLSRLDLDPGGGPSDAVGASLAEITGFTEWVTHTLPAVSLGWDWSLQTGAGELSFARSGEPRSNVMLINSLGRDLGPAHTAAVLAMFVDELPWHDSVAACVRTHYA